ncbi:hypothetical protein C3941_04475 [Kaistia algarum]|uniref:DUF937 domain-containing protein n=1 Tax=Kaistia algarum TaxID=2083279 RepID=UPI000CE78141|nr:DUF937 domain-containing protein [Kaistia algarum]MCX5512528.1 DUF937 domain-containing protein [Kaistia algarum]PPE81943.1 hypothetical protein C3941_04475 [Kaistia algarum]
MTNFFDMMQDAQRNAMAALASSNFGLPADQQAKALEAMTPAFWLGLKKNTSDPFGVTAFWQQLAGGQYKSYFENPLSAVTPSGMADGNKLVEAMFGSPEVSRAVALQVEAATGIAQDVVRRMMPVYANVMMGGLQRQSESFGNPFTKFMQEMTQPKASAPKPADFPFVTMMEAFLGKEPEKAPEPKPDEPMSQEEVIDRMFDAGRSMQDNYWKSMERIFDQFGGGKKQG